MGREEALLYDGRADRRLEGLSGLVKQAREGGILPPKGKDVNNHIHTTYSFSPYSPSAAVWYAYMAGLETCGIMDHDSLAGADEFIKAGHIAGMKVTVGMECRVSFLNTQLKSKGRINNPDQNGIVYMALHGVPHDMIDRVEEYIKPYREKRNLRNRDMTERINELVKDVSLDFDRDIVPLSMWHDGGSITERHISCGLAKKLIEKFGKGEKLFDFMAGTLSLPVTAKLTAYMKDAQNEHYLYDLLGWIKSDLVPRFYIDASGECPDVREVIALSEEVGAISAYAYLGDVGESVTGDKRAQKFEDEFIDELFEVISALGFRAVTYMPSRNTRAQLERVRTLCEKHGLFQISGEDINSPRQEFVCMAMRDEAFSNLFDSTYALIAHEWRSTQDRSLGLFSEESAARWPDLNDRVKAFAAFGREMI